MVVRYVVPSSIALVLAWAVTPASAAIVETYGEPGVENASSVVVTNANTLGVENFDSLPMGSSGFTTNYGTGGLITGVYSGRRRHCSGEHLWGRGRHTPIR